MLTESKKCQISGSLNLYKPSWQHHVNDLPLNWIQPMLYSSKEENLLVLFKYQDPFL